MPKYGSFHDYHEMLAVISAIELRLKTEKSKSLVKLLVETLDHCRVMNKNGLSKL